METTITQPILLPAELLKNWQGHRNLTRRVIEAFPEVDNIFYFTSSPISFIAK
jgi:hypothetical protein